jgi:hypothetical protein
LSRTLNSYGCCLSVDFRHSSPRPPTRAPLTLV